MLINIVCFAALSVYLVFRLLYELQMMQQNSYRNSRYFRWLKSDRYNVHRIWIWSIFVISCLFFGNTSVKIGISVVSIIGVVYETTRKYKKALVYTNRAIRLFTTALVLSELLIVITSHYFKNANYPLLMILLLNALSFGVLIIANLINAPLEFAINRSFYRDAKRILKQHKNLIIIGITGSYGKTSTKHYLYRLLSERYNVLMTPGSYNTPMGIVRTIREKLKPYHEIFIVEMGAKQPGDIKEICNLVHPSIAILTSVGEQHLETFKTIKNVQKTKFELIDALPRDGLAVLNADYETITSRNVGNVENCLYYSSYNRDVDYSIVEINYSQGGTDFTVKQKDGTTEHLSTKIVGKHNLSNILAGFVVAKYLNVETNAIKYAVSRIEQVEHRLHIRQSASGITIIDDSFNSNPVGAEMALEVLKGFQGGKRIVVTPGMIELGEKQYEYNYTFGQQIAASADYVVVVGEYNREAITKGLLDSHFEEKNLCTTPSFALATTHLNNKLQKGDTVLYENDLPDTFT